MPKTKVITEKEALKIIEECNVIMFALGLQLGMQKVNDKIQGLSLVKECLENRNRPSLNVSIMVLRDFKDFINGAKKITPSFGAYESKVDDVLKVLELKQQEMKG